MEGEIKIEEKKVEGDIKIEEKKMEDVKLNVNLTRVGIKLVCKCGRDDFFEKMYYCRVCQYPKCDMCLREEIIAYFCPQCMESLSSTEVHDSKGRCNKCFSCPLCYSPVTCFVKLTEVETFYLKCTSCEWDSLTCLKDPLIASSPSDLIIEYQKRTQSLLPQQTLVNNVVNSLLNLQRSNNKKLKQANLLKKLRNIYSSTSIPRKHMKFLTPRIGTNESSIGEGSGSVKTIKEIDIEQEEKSKPVIFEINFVEKDLEEFNPVIDDLKNVSNLNQRLSNPSSQSKNMRDIYPSRVQIVTRRKKSCITCDEILVKPDIDPYKVTFERLRLALLNLPQIKLKNGEYKELLVTRTLSAIISNPTDFIMELHISPHQDQRNSAMSNLNIKTKLGTNLEAIEISDQLNPNIFFRLNNTIHVLIPFELTKDESDVTEIKISFQIYVQYNNSYLGLHESTYVTSISVFQDMGF